jgi:Rps23 Pro-64 3,4-dihydroxylase Tpa1-like proline 4-hydroxylase
MLNPALDRAVLAKRYRAKQRIQIRDVLAGEAAKDLLAILAKGTEWSLVYREADGHVEVLSQTQMQQLPQEDRARRINGIYQRARNEFSFIYQANLMADRYAAGIEPSHPLHRVFEYLNGAQFMGLIRDVTGIESIARADAQATLYAPGHFLSNHDDKIGGHKRRVAYILSMTPDWNPDWGGILQFYDGENGIEDAFVPRFNALSLFTVPQSHAVSYVAPFAEPRRIAITGWFVDP